MKQVFKVLGYVVAGFFAYTVALLAFFTMPGSPVWVKVVMMAGFSVPAAVGLAVGLALAKPGCRWRDTGIVLLSAGCFSLFIALTFAFYLQQEEFRKMLPPQAIRMITGYWEGFSVIAVLIVAGGLSLRYGLGQVRAAEESAAESQGNEAELT